MVRELYVLVKEWVRKGGWWDDGRRVIMVDGRGKDLRR